MAKSKRNDEEQPRVEVENTAPELDWDRVAQRACGLYLSRGGADGGGRDDWLIAQQEVIRNKKPENES